MPLHNLPRLPACFSKLPIFTDVFSTWASISTILVQMKSGSFSLSRREPVRWSYPYMDVNMTMADKYFISHLRYLSPFIVIINEKYLIKHLQGKTVFPFKWTNNKISTMVIPYYSYLQRKEKLMLRLIKHSSKKTCVGAGLKSTALWILKLCSQWCWVASVAHRPQKDTYVLPIRIFSRSNQEIGYRD